MREKKRARNKGAEESVLRMEVASNLIHARRHHEAHFLTDAVKHSQGVKKEAKREGRRSTLEATESLMLVDK